jgi:hypothetical protein
MRKSCPSYDDPLIGVMLPKREFDNAIMAEQLSSTTVERNKRSDDTKIPASLCDVSIPVHFGYRKLYECYAESTSKRVEERHSQIPRTINVNVRKRNRAVRPMDLRREPMLWEARAQKSGGRSAPVTDADRGYSQK